MRTALFDQISARNRPSFYATPVAWAAAQFTDVLWAEADGLEPQRTGLIVASDECSLHTIRELAGTAVNGSVSPLRFAGASPSIVAGLPALQHGIRGPTVALTMPPEHAVDAVVALGRYWMRYCDVVSVVAIAHHAHRGRHLFKGMVARLADRDLRQQVLQLCQVTCAEQISLSGV